jgi:hypothetical protein
MQAAGGFLIASSLVPTFKDLARNRQFGRRTQLTLNPISALEGGGKAAAEEWQRNHAWTKAFALQMRDRIDKAFPNLKQQELLIHAIERDGSAEMAMLTPKQQEIARSLRNYNDELGDVLVAIGAIDTKRKNYFTQIFPRDEQARVFRLMRQQKGRASSRGPFSLDRTFDTLKSAEAAGFHPRKDAANVFAIHIQEANKAIFNHRLVSQMERLGLVARDPIEANWGQVAIGGNLLTNKFAPPEVKAALEAIFSQSPTRDAWDRVASLMLRSIMFWHWEHGLNVVRAGIAASTGPRSWIRAARALSNGDASVLKAAQDGLLVGARTDLGRQALSAFESNLAKLGEGAPLLKRLSAGAKDRLEKEQRLLWERIVPGVGLATYWREMNAFTRRFPQATEAQITRAGHEAAKYANDVMGLVPKGMASAQVGANLRKMFFAPSWLRTRINLKLNAWGEMGDILEGKLDPRDARYLMYNVRMALIGGAVTVGLAQAFTRGESMPVFNERTGKFYAPTGIRDPRTGRELGVDLIAWYQDDLRLVSDPVKFFAHKANPLLKAISENVLAGRDYTGRPLEGIERLENTIQALGPVGAILTTPGRVAVEGGSAGGAVAGAAIGAAGGALLGAPPEFTAIAGGAAGSLFGGDNSTEAMRQAFRIAGLSGVSTLPTEADIALSEMAKK